MSYLAPFILMHIFYLWALKRNDLSVIDIFWPLGFLALSLTSLVLNSDISAFKMVLLTLVTIWSLRLGGYLGWRLLSHGEEDKRYTSMRVKWKGPLALNAYLRVYLVQFLIQTIIALPLYFYFKADGESLWNLNHFVGLLLFFYGLFFQVWADFGLAKFKALPNNKGRLYTEGAWKFSQHPNYFGEAAIWFGFFIFTLNISPLWTAISPVVLLFFLLKVSGIPLLAREEKYGASPEYQEYRSRTSLFVPWYPRED